MRYILEHGIGITLRWIVDIGVVEQILDSEQDLREMAALDCQPRLDCATAHLLDGNRGLPGLLFIEDREAHCTRGVHVRVEQWWGEFAYECISTCTITGGEPD